MSDAEDVEDRPTKRRKIMYGDDPQINENNLIQQLTAEGFSESEACSALKLSIEDDDECDGLDLSKCKQSLQLIQTLSMDSKDNDLDAIMLNNNFNHYLFTHPTDKDIDYIHCRLNKCNMSECKYLQRYYKQRRIQSTETEDNKIIIQDEHKYDENDPDILDKIHCHFYHCYDIGIRLTEKEKNELNTHDENKENDTNKRIVNLRKLLLKKRENLNSLINIKQNNENKENKFCSNLNKSQLEHNYSYSFKFFYWRWYKNVDYWASTTNGYDAKQLYIEPKYTTLKQEAISNEICPISINVFNEKYKKALLTLKTDHAKTIVANIDNYMIKYKNTSNHISNYGIKHNESIQLNHLLSMILYCDLDEFQHLYSSTCRLKPSEHFNDLKKRHSNFHFLAKYLRECVECFGDKYMDSKIEIFYHGITKEMTFESVKPYINGPLSTTSDYSVALSFATNVGIVIELVPDPSLKYFQCCWLSEYPYEQECFYIGGIYTINFINITFCINGWELRQYITALRLIETLFDGRYFAYDYKVIHKMRRYQWTVSNVGVLKLKQLPKVTHKLVISLINHQLKNQFNNSSTELPTFINNTLNCICNNKKRITINMETFETDITKEIKPNHSGGYIGYSFLSHLFVTKNKEINLNVINKLLPNLKFVIICNISYISSSLIPDIITTLSKHHVLEWFQLYTSNKANCSISSTVTEQLYLLAPQMTEMGITFEIGNNSYFGDGFIIRICTETHATKQICGKSV